jgi:hypothetical protein
MRISFWIFIFSLTSFRISAQNVSLTIIADKQSASGAGIFINGKLKAIANGQGKVQLTGIHDKDTLRISYLGYKPETIILSSQNEALNINLTQENFEIGEIEVSPSNDMSLFKKMLKWGLQIATVYKAIPFYMEDTLQFSSGPDQLYNQFTGTFIAPRRGYEITVKKLQTEQFSSIQILNEKDDDFFKNKKIPKQSIETCFVFPYGLASFNRDLRLTYLGKDSTGYEQFYFSITNDNWIHGSSPYKAHCGGIVSLDSEGIITKIKAHKTSFDATVSNYEFDIDYVYDKKSNEIMPYSANIQICRIDEELNVISTRSAHLELYGKQAIAAGIITYK